MGNPWWRGTHPGILTFPDKPLGAPMAKANPLQEQLLKAGLVKKSKVAQVAREQAKARAGKAPPAAGGIEREAQRARAEKAERDRALEAERRASLRQRELQAQARQIIRDRRVPRSGESEYRFTADGVIRTLLVDDELRQKLAAGVLVIVRGEGDGFELLPRAAADQVRERDASMVMLDHGQADAAVELPTDEDAAYYAQFKVPDDLVW